MFRSTLFLALLLLSFPAFAQLRDPGGTGYDNEAADFGVPPRATLHTGSPHAPTPLSVPGAKTITTAQLYAKLTSQQPMLLLYVNHPTSDAIQGSHWLDGAGTGTSLTDIVQARFQEKVDQFTRGNKNAAIVVYCYDSDCWLSYNAALRLVQAGYRDVNWYRGGRGAWKAAGLPTVQLSPEVW